MCECGADGLGPCAPSCAWVAMGPGTRKQHEALAARLRADQTKHEARTCESCTRARVAVVSLCPRPSCTENGHCTALAECTLRPPLDAIARRP